MANVYPDYKNADAYGLPTFESLDTYLQQNLMAGAEPAMMPAVPMLAGDSQTLAQFTVVGLSGGKIVPATTSIAPIGVLAHGFTSGASNTTIFAHVWVKGCFNAGADSPLIWDASLNTEALKTGSVTGKDTANLIFRRRLAA